MIEKSMELKRFNESKRLIKSVIIMQLTVSLFMILAMIFIVRVFACFFLPEAVAESIIECFWL